MAQALLPAGSGPSDPRLDFLQEIEERSRSMNPKPDGRDLLREGREGAMYGESSAYSPCRTSQWRAESA